MSQVTTQVQGRNIHSLNVTLLESAVESRPYVRLSIADRDTEPNHFDRTAGKVAHVWVDDLLDALGYEDRTEEMEAYREAFGPSEDPEPKYKAGQLVRIVEHSAGSNITPRDWVGKVAEVLEYDPDRAFPVRVKVSDTESPGLFEEEVAPVGEPRVGDRVRVTSHPSWHVHPDRVRDYEDTSFVGKVGTVVEPNTHTLNGDVVVEFDHLSSYDHRAMRPEHVEVIA